MDSAAGRRIADRYLLVEPLARGAMGQLWVARDLNLDRDVALKLIGDRQRFDEAAHLRFKREALATARLKSAHVVPVFDHGIDGDAAYIVMELLEGMNLGDYLARSGALALDHVVWVCEQVARGLTAAHEAGVLHRDLKPANLFLTLAAPHPVIKLLDFGIARLDGFQGSTTATGELVGSPIYMSPEQAQGFEMGTPSDLFSLATILHNTLSGERAFDAATLAVVFDRLRAVDVEPITHKRPGLPAALDGFFARAMQPHPAQRFQTAMDFHRAFIEAAGVVPRPLPHRPEDASTGSPVRVPEVSRKGTVAPVSVSYRVHPAGHRLSLVAGIAALSLAIFGIAGYLVTSRGATPTTAKDTVPPSEEPPAPVAPEPTAPVDTPVEAATEAPVASTEVDEEPVRPEASTKVKPRPTWRPRPAPAKGAKPKIDLDYD